MVKKLFLIISLCSSILLLGFKDTGKSNYKITKVVIDAGHGGHDPGNLGTRTLSTTEKDVALDVSLRIGKYIEENLPDVEVVYTRTQDVFIELYERAALANRLNANCFISVHCNSATPAAYGTETYVMGLHVNEANLNVAMRENSSVYLEEDYAENYDGFDPKNDEDYIIMSLMQSAFQDQSTLLAQKVEEQFASKLKRKSRGVKQAGFLVLYKTSMPSILVETGFLTNKTEETYLNSEDGQDYMASAVYRAFKEFKIEMEAL